MEGSPNARRPTTAIIAAAGLFLLAVLLGRLLIAGGGAWVALLIVVPILVFALSAAVSLRFGLVVAASFIIVVLGVRWLLQQNPLGWIGLALLPIVALTAALVGRVLAQMRRDHRERLEAENAES